MRSSNRDSKNVYICGGKIFKRIYAIERSKVFLEGNDVHVCELLEKKVVPNEEFKDFQLAVGNKYKKYMGMKGVYVIKSGGLYKIGKSINIGSRLQGLEGCMPGKMDVVHCIECDNEGDIEKNLHRKFDYIRVKGEWFDLSDENVLYIKNL